MILVKENTDDLIKKCPFKSIPSIFRIIDEQPSGGFYDYGAPKVATFNHYVKGFESSFIDSIKPKESININNMKVIIKNGIYLFPTSNKDIAISSNGRLYSFKENKYTTRQYHSIEEIKSGIFYVIDKILCENDNYDYFMFIINNEDKIISSIYSQLEDNKYSVDKNMSYDEIREKRINELSKMILNEKRNIIKKKLLK